MTPETPQTPPQTPQNPGNTGHSGQRRLGGGFARSGDEGLVEDVVANTVPADSTPLPYPEMTVARGPVSPVDEVNAAETISAEQFRPDPAPSEGGKGGGKRPRKLTAGQILNASKHQEDYKRMMKAGWTSFALERFADYRYGEKIAASTFRNWKSRKLAKDPGWLDVTYLTDKAGNELIAHGVEVDLDVMGVRQQLVHLQLQRIGVLVAAELNESKLGGETWRELKLASEMLDKVREDQVAYGIMPAVAGVTRFTIDDLPDDIPKAHSTLAGAIGAVEMPKMDAAAVARELGKLIPITRNQNRSAV